MRKIFILFVFTLLLTGCGNMDKKISELDKIIADNNYIVVDVRTKDEYQEGHVKDSINIPYDEIDSNISLDKSKTILVYCRSGVRSKKAKSSLISLGYQVYDMGSFSNVPFEKV